MEQIRNAPKVAFGSTGEWWGTHSREERADAVRKILGFGADVEVLVASDWASLPPELKRGIVTKFGV